MTTIGMLVAGRDRMIEEGYATLQDRLDPYSKTDDLRKLIVNLNKTFGMASGVDRAYYPTTVSRRLCGIHWYLNICVSAMDVVPDIDTITIVLANDYANDYE